MCDNCFFPTEFDYDFYKMQWAKAGELSRQDAYGHFLKFGKTCGLAGSPLSDMHFFVHFLDRMHFRQILEIGPGPKPRMFGDNVYYFDVNHGEGLLVTAGKMGIDAADVPEIHYHSDDGSLACIDRKFDLVFSSHCIEHVYDPIAHLNEVADLLEDGGYYAMIVPDKRYTFDYFRPLSSLGDIVDQNYRGLRRHTLKTLVDSIYAAHNDPPRHWDNDHGELTKIAPEQLEEAVELYRSREGKMPSRHGWVFTDDSFRELYTQLAAMGLTRLRPRRVYNTIRNSNSFCVVMEKIPEA